MIRVNVETRGSVEMDIKRMENATLDDIFNIVDDELYFSIMDQAVADCPVITGNLRRTANYQKMRTGDGFFVSGGFSASYAEKVDVRRGYFTYNIENAEEQINARIEDWNRKVSS